MNSPNQPQPQPQPQALRIAVIVLAVIGGVSLLSAASMVVMHGSMMTGIGC